MRETWNYFASFRHSGLCYYIERVEWRNPKYNNNNKMNGNVKIERRRKGMPNFVEIKWLDGIDWEQKTHSFSCKYVHKWVKIRQNISMCVRIYLKQKKRIHSFAWNLMYLNGFVHAGVCRICSAAHTHTHSNIQYCARS